MNSNVRMGIGLRRHSVLIVLLMLLVSTRPSVAQLTGPYDRGFQNKTAVADTLTEKLLAQRQAIRAGTDAQALESAVDAKTYILGPGDGVYLNVYAAHFLDQDLTLTPEGKLIVPRTGEVDLAGLTMVQAEEKVNKLLMREYKNPEAHLSLRRLRSMKVSVLGEVLSPGVQTVTALVRVSEVISKSGDLRETSSLRNIEIHRPDGSLRAKADLSKYYLTGDLTANPHVEGGDIIIVPRAMLVFTINGAVGKTGTFEFSPGDKLSTAIALAQGLKPSARLDSIEIARFSPESPLRATRMYVNMEANNDPELHEGDVISIKGSGQYHASRLVSIGGEIEYPGKYSIENGETRLLDVIQRAGGILSTGSLTEAVVLRRSGVGSWESDPEYIMLDRMHISDEKHLTPDQYNYYMARSRQLGRSVMVVNFKELVDKGDMSQNILLRDQDSIWIPRERGYVSVIGSVNNPGNINYMEGASYSDYINRAGGYTSSADESAVRVINSRTSTYIDPRSDSHYIIGNGDTIVIPPERPTFWQNFQLVTAVTAQVLTIIAGIFLLTRK